ncbi:stalk domain-containing protein [Loigolactobacillus iwatensis]|uniref:stalk domain-containing protein n=1 Tax=Loigolactobacillus iwatensis TaxID=1267156 RepID=UPI000F7E8910|nr:stalk domain-containing protein [Loigolactobacillus iwatensis]
MMNSIEDRISSYLQWNRPVTVVVDDHRLPVIGLMVNSQIYIPLKAYFQALNQKLVAQGFNVSGDYLGDQFEFTLGTKTLRINGISFPLDQAPFGSNQEIYVSAAFVAVLTRHTYEWAASDRLILFLPLDDANFEVSIAEFPPFSVLPKQFLHKDLGGDGHIPTLFWANAPKETKSFAVMLGDEHPIAAGYSYWNILGLPASATGVAAKDDLSRVTQRSYRGVAPMQSSGYHEYLFYIFALDEAKVATTGALNTIDDAKRVFHGHILDVGIYPTFAML